MGAVLALASAVCYGVADYAGGLLARRASSTWVALFGQVGALVVTLLAAPIVGASAVTSLEVAWGALSGVGTGLGMVFLFRGMSRGEISVVVPISAVASVALAVLIGVAVLGDRPSVAAWIGIVVAVPALWLVSGGTWRGRIGAGVSRGALDGFLASIAIAVQYLALAQATPEAGIWPVLAARVTATVAVAVAAQQTRAAWRLPQSVAVPSALVGVLMALALVLYLFATRQQTVSIAVVLASLYPVIPVLLGVTVLRERLMATQVVGLIGAGLAIPLITWG
jgi:uncharacterized membrane protein